MVALFLFINGIQGVSKRGLEVKVDKQQELIEVQSEALETSEMIEDELEKELNVEKNLNVEAKSDLEEAKEIEEKLNEEIKKLEKDLQAKLERDRLAKLASTRTVSTPAVVAAPKVGSPAPVQSAPVVATQSVVSNGGVSAGTHDGVTGAYGQCVYGVDAAVGIPGGGNAKDYAWILPQHGYQQGVIKINSIAVFQPGVLGSHSIYGHIAYVVGIDGDNITIREMNYFGNGGGFGIYNTRVVNRYSGVQFFSL